MRHYHTSGTPFAEIEQAREIIKAMEPVYNEYHELYAKERVRDKVEEVYQKTLDDEPER